MVAYEVSGGLGNQFFRYAFARNLQEQRKQQGIHDILAINYGAIDKHDVSGDFSDFNLTEHEDYTCRRLFVDYIQKHLDDPTFIVFSNDLNWVKENLKINGNVYYESGDDPVWETYRLMYS